jgi:hypothetical protein
VPPHLPHEAQSDRGEAGGGTPHLAKQLKAALDAIVKALEADKQLPDAVEVKAGKTVKNPFE